MKIRFSSLFARNSGFTLVELLLAMFILSIIIAAFMPLISQSYLGIFEASKKSKVLFEEQGDMESRLAEKITYRGGSIPIQFEGKEKKDILGGIVETGNLTSFLAWVPTISLNPNTLVEGYADRAINVEGTDNNFISGKTELNIKDKNGWPVSRAYYSLTVKDKNKATITLRQGLTNAASPYSINIKTPVNGKDQIVRAKLIVQLPRLVAVGNQGLILVSDGANWTKVNSIVNASLKKIVWGKERYVAVAEDKLIITLTHGTPWTQQRLNHQLNSIVWGGPDGKESFVAVGEGGVIFTSTDAKSWQAQKSGTTNNLNGIAWAREVGEFITIGEQGTILTSPDGKTWSNVALTENGPELNGVICGYFKFKPLCIAVGEATIGNSKPTIIVSYDGVKDWSIPSNLPDIDESLNSITWGYDEKEQPLFMAVGQREVVLIWSSADSDWKQVFIDKDNIYKNFNDITFSGKNFVAVGDGLIVSSADGGKSWSKHTTETNLNGVTSGGQ